MRAVVRCITSETIECPLAEYAPPNANNFRIPVRVYLGSDEGEGEDSFDLYICTPHWLSDECERAGVVNGLHHLIVARFDYQAIDRKIHQLFGNIDGQEWKDIAIQANRFGAWEFDGYRE